jgi:hypothetical protein
MKRIGNLAFGVSFLLAVISFWSGVAAAFFVPSHVAFFGKAFLGFTGLALIFGLLSF